MNYYDNNGRKVSAYKYRKLLADFRQCAFYKVTVEKSENKRKINVKYC